MKVARKEGRKEGRRVERLGHKQIETDRQRDRRRRGGLEERFVEPNNVVVCYASER